MYRGCGMLVRPGLQIGPYVVAREIARGGQGVVCEARHTTQGTEVALKLLLDDDPDSLARFQREGRTLQRLSHPGVLRIDGLGALPSGVPYLAMELVRGRSLKDWVKRAGLPPLERAVEVVVRVAEALDHCHEQGLVHRDVKPENVLLEDGTERVVVVDFGLVRRRKLELAWSTQDKASLTEDGSILGTPAYMAPEQASSELGEVDRRTDVYALGGLLFFLLTGEPPFGGGAGAWGVLVSVLTEPARDPRELRPDLPEPLAELCLRCLAKSPGDRPRSAKAFADELRRVGLGHPRPNPAPLLAALAGLCLASLGLWAWTRPGEAPAPSGSVSPGPLPTQASTTPAPVTSMDRLRQAAEAGDPQARLALALALERTDPQRAAHWLELAAQQGSPHAMRRLASAYVNGTGVPKDLDRALDLYRRAAAKNDGPSHRSLGVHYRIGAGVPVDLGQASRHFKRAAELGDAEGMVLWGSLLVAGSGVRRDWAVGLGWIRRAAEAGNLKAMTYAGLLLLGDQGGDANLPEALRWLRLAAKRGSLPAMCGLGKCHEEGLGVRKDRARAAEWYGRAAKAGSAQGMVEYARRLQAGRGVRQDLPAAFRWYQRAAEKHEMVGAMVKLATMHAKGIGVPRDPKRSAAWLRRAAERGNVPAMTRLGWALGAGDPSIRDLDQGRRWLEKAVGASKTPRQRARARRLLARLQGEGGR